MVYGSNGRQQWKVYGSNGRCMAAMEGVWQQWKVYGIDNGGVMFVPIATVISIVLVVAMAAVSATNAADQSP